MVHGMYGLQAQLIFITDMHLIPTAYILRTLVIYSLCGWYFQVDLLIIISIILIVFLRNRSPSTEDPDGPWHVYPSGRIFVNYYYSSYGRIISPDIFSDEVINLECYIISSGIIQGERVSYSYGIL